MSVSGENPELRLEEVSADGKGPRQAEGGGVGWWKVPRGAVGESGGCPVAGRTLRNGRRAWKKVPWWGGPRGLWEQAAARPVSLVGPADAARPQDHGAVPVRGGPAWAAEAGHADPERAACAMAAQGQGERPRAQPRRRVAHEAGQSLPQLQQDAVQDTR